MNYARSKFFKSGFAKVSGFTVCWNHSWHNARYVILAVFQVFFVNTEPANKTFKTALEQIDIL